MTEIEEKIDNEVIISGDFNNDPNKGRFIEELICFIDDFQLVCLDIDRLPSDSYMYIIRNQIGSISWLGHVITSKNNVVMNKSFLYGHTIDHIPVSRNVL